MKHDRNYLRYKSLCKALRKKKISDSWFNDGHHWYTNLHAYSKNKIHCSCPMCSSKTYRDGYKISDLRKIQSLEDSF